MFGETDVADEQRRPKDARAELAELGKRSLLNPIRGDLGVTLPPHLGGDVKNIRRRLEPPKPDIATLCTSIVSAIATFSAAVALNEKGVAFGWVAMLILTTGASLTAAAVSFWNTFQARKNPDLIQAQADADILVTWQDEARVKVDRELRSRISEPLYRLEKPVSEETSEEVSSETVAPSEGKFTPPK